MIYFIQFQDPAETQGPIKIGRANDLNSRLSRLQVGSPYELKLLAVLTEEDPLHEKRLHQQFNQVKLRGEWFRPTENLLQFIKNIPPHPASKKIQKRRGRVGKSAEDYHCTMEVDHNAPPLTEDALLRVWKILNPPEQLIESFDGFSTRLGKTIQSLEQPVGIESTP